MKTLTITKSGNLYFRAPIAIAGKLYGTANGVPKAALNLKGDARHVGEVM